MGVGWGGLACTLTSIKTVISQPVCALTDHSKHYAQHRGWTTLDYSTEIMFFLFVFFRRHPPESGDNAGQTPLQVFKTIECCIFTCWVLRAYISVMSLFISSPRVSCAPVPLPIVLSCLVSPPPHKEKEKRKKRLCTFIKRNKIIGLIGLVVVKETCVETPPKKKTQQHIPQLPAHHIHASTFIILLIFI